MKNVLLILSVLLAGTTAMAQTHCYIKYSYDDSGNRINREFVCDGDSAPDDPEGTTGGGTTTSGGGSTWLATNAEVVDTLVSDVYSILYPNPNNGEFWVEFFEEIPQSKLYILDNSGRIIFQDEITEMKSYIDIRGQKSGLYYVVIYDGTRNETHKLEVLE